MPKDSSQRVCGVSPDVSEPRQLDELKELVERVPATLSTNELLMLLEQPDEYYWKEAGSELLKRCNAQTQSITELQRRLDDAELERQIAYYDRKEQRDRLAD